MKKKMDNLSTCDKIFSEFKQKYKSREDYLERWKFPIISFETAHMSIETNNILGMQSYLIQSASNDLFPIFYSLYYDVYNTAVQRLAVDHVILQLTHHGECGVQSGGLILQLMQQNIPIIKRVNIDDSLHAFVVVANEDESEEYALDPYFKLSCPLDELWNNKQLLQYGRAVTQKNDWKPDANTCIETVYPYKTYKSFLPIIEKQIIQLMQFKDYTAVKNQIALLHYAMKLNANNVNKTELRQHVRFCFNNTLTANNELTSDQIRTYLDKYFPLPKPAITQPAFFKKSPQDELLEQITAIVNQLNRGKTLIALIKDKKYGSALRTACNDKDGFIFVKCMLSYQDTIAFNINEKAGANQLAAIDYAAKHEDKKTYLLLLEHGAIVPEINASTTI